MLCHSFLAGLKTVISELPPASTALAASICKKITGRLTSAIAKVSGSVILFCTRHLEPFHIERLCLRDGKRMCITIFCVAVHIEQRNISKETIVNANAIAHCEFTVTFTMPLKVARVRTCITILPLLQQNPTSSTVVKQRLERKPSLKLHRTSAIKPKRHKCRKGFRD